MSPIASEYDLGKAHGTVVIDYEDRGTKKAQDDLNQLDKQAQAFIRTLVQLRSHLRGLSTTFGETGARFARTFAIISGGTAVLLGVSGALTTFTGRLFALRGGISILGALGITMGGLPGYVQGFPNVVKQLIILSSAITLFAGSSKLLNSVFVQLGRLAASTRIVQSLAAAFPLLTKAITTLVDKAPSLKDVGEGVDRIGRPVHQIARLALGIGALIATIRTGVSVAFALAKGIAKIGAASTAVILLTKAFAVLIATLQELGGLIGAIPAALGLFAAGLATVKLGLKGFKDALKNFDDLEKFEESLKKLAPAAAGFLREIRSFKDAFDDVQRSIQEELFRDLARFIRPLAEVYLPLLRTGAGQVAAALNRVAQSLAETLLQGRNVQSIAEIFRLTAVFIDNARVALAPFISGLLDVAVVGGQALVDFSSSFAELGENFASITARAREDGSMRAWIDGGIQGLVNLIATFVNLGQILNTIFAAFGVEAGGVTAAMQRGTDAIRDFLRSAEGQEILHTLVDTIQLLSGVTTGVLLEALRALIPVLVALRPFIEEVATSMGDSLLVVIKALAPVLLVFAETLSAISPIIGPIIGFFLGLGVAGKALIFIFGPIVAGINLLVQGFAILRGAITGITIAWRLLQFLFAVSPWGVIITALVLLVVLIITNWDKISEYLAVAWEWIKRTAETVWNAIVGFFTGIWDAVVDAFQTAWNWILDFLKKIWEGIKFVFLNFTVVGLIIKYWDDIVEFTKKAWNAIVDFLKGIWNGIVDSTRFIWEPIVDIFTSIFTIIYDVIRTHINLILIVIIHVWESIRDTTLFIWEGIKWVLNQVWQFLVDTFHSIWDPISEWWNKFWTAITTVATRLWDEFTTWLQEKWDIAIKAWHMFFDPIVEWWNGFWNGIKTTASGLIDGIVEKIKWAWDLAWKIFHDTFDPIIAWFRRIWNDISTAVSDGVRAVVDFVGSLPGKIVSAIGDLGSLLLEHGKKIIQGFLNGLKNAFKDVQDFVGGIADWIASHKGPISTDKRLLIPAGEAIMGGLLNGLASKRSIIEGFMQDLTSDIANGINTAGKEISAATGTLSTSTNVGVITTAASAVTNPATTSGAIPAIATAPVAAVSAGGGTTVIERVEVKIDTILDPTDPMQWKKTMEAIHEGIRQVDRERK